MPAPPSALELTRQLLRFDTINPPGRERSCAETLGRILEAGGAEVGFQEFASLPDIDGRPARPMLLIDEPGSGRLFANDMRGPLYTVTYDGSVALYLDVNAPRWGVPVESSGRERGMQIGRAHV